MTAVWSRPPASCEADPSYALRVVRLSLHVLLRRERLLDPISSKLYRGIRTMDGLRTGLYRPRTMTMLVKVKVPQGFFEPLLKFLAIGPHPDLDLERI